MPQQLIYTSAPRGVVAGRSGYCTVARSATMREALMLRLEQLSYYQHLSLSGGREHPIFAYRIVDIRGTRFHVLSRIQDAGLDYTGRTNFIAHHLAFTPEEIPQLASPAVLFSRWNGWNTSWTREAQILEREDWSGLAALANTSCLPAKTWAQITGDAANGYGLLEAKAGACFQVDAASENQVLPLFAESAELSEARDPRGNHRVTAWQYTFTTSLQEQDASADFRWRMAHVNNPAYAKLAGGNCPPLTSVRAASCTEEERAFANQGRKAPGTVVVQAKQTVVSEGSTARFEARSDGLPQPTFQWYEVEQGTPKKLEGQTGAILEVVARGRSKRYMVRATNSVNFRDSAPVELTITGMAPRGQKPVGGSSWEDAPTVVPKNKKPQDEGERLRKREESEQAEKIWKRKQSTRRMVILAVVTLVVVAAAVGFVLWKSKSTPTVNPASTNQPPGVVAADPNAPTNSTTASGATNAPSPTATNSPSTNAEPPKAKETSAATNPPPTTTQTAPQNGKVREVPPQWKLETIGNPTAHAEYSFTNNTYLITGAGTPFNQNSDCFSSLQQKVSGDGDLTAEFLNFYPPRGGELRCGLMFRESLNQDSPFVFIGAGPQYSLSAFRNKTGERAQEKNYQGSPEALKLSRTGDKFEFSCRYKGQWLPMGAIEMKMPTNCIAALVVSSGRVDQSVKAWLRNVEWHSNAVGEK